MVLQTLVISLVKQLHIKRLGLFTDFTATRGSASGYQVGVARVRAVEYFSGTIGNNDAQFKVILFDVRMFTYLNLVMDMLMYS